MGDRAAEGPHCCGVPWLITQVSFPSCFPSRGVCKAAVCQLSVVSAHTSGRARADSSAEIRGARLCQRICTAEDKHIMEACGVLTGVRGRFSLVNLFTFVLLFRNCFSFFALCQSPGIPVVRCGITELAPEACVASKTLRAVEMQLGFR